LHPCQNHPSGTVTISSGYEQHAIPNTSIVETRIDSNERIICHT